MSADFWPEQLASLEQSLTRPNPRQTWSELRREAKLDFDLCGLCYFWLVPGEGDSVREVHALRPWHVLPQPGGGYRIKDSCRLAAQARDSELVCSKQETPL